MEAPYPANTKAKGWRLELDYEAIAQSDTWDLASEIPMAQPVLLMMWLTSWTQQPCGSFPNDENVIRAKCKVPPVEWERMRDVLMRGWWLADDGRLYHPTVTLRVLSMLGAKDSERDRKAKYRANKEAERKLAELQGSPEMSHGTDMGRPWESHGVDATGTGTGTGTGLDSSYPPPREGVDGNLSHGTAAGQICKAMKSQGLAGVSPSNQKLLTLIESGAELGEFIDAAKEAVEKQAGFAYALSIVANARTRAAELRGTLHKGPLAVQGKQAALEERNRSVAESWVPPSMRGKPQPQEAI